MTLGPTLDRLKNNSKSRQKHCWNDALRGSFSALPVLELLPLAGIGLWFGPALVFRKFQAFNPGLYSIDPQKPVEGFQTSQPWKMAPLGLAHCSAGEIDLLARTAGKCLQNSAQIFGRRWLASPPNPPTKTALLLHFLTLPFCWTAQLGLPLRYPEGTACGYDVSL